MTIEGTLLMAFGGGLFALVLMQMFMAFAGSLARVKSESDYNKLSIQLLKQKMEAMKALHKEYDHSSRYSWTGYRKFRVEVKKEAPDVTSCYLHPHDGKALPPFKPGQFLTFQLKLPHEDKPLIRCYSLSDKPSPDYYRVSVKKVLPPRGKPELPPGKSSSYFNEILKDGDIIDVKVPSGNFFLETREQYPIVLIGGGIGITPVYSMLRTLVDEGSQREVWFFYGVRHGAEAIYSEELKEIERTQPNMTIVRCFSDPQAEDKDGEDFQHAGRVSVELFKSLLGVNNFEFYICGPPPMMQSLVRDLEAWGVPQNRVRFEAFGPATVKKSKPVQADGEKNKSEADFAVKFSQSGKECLWTGKEDSLLELAENNDIAMASGCRVGNCGTCMVALKSGSVAYATEPTFDIEKGSCLACVAVPKEPVEIDG